MEPGKEVRLYLCLDCSRLKQGHRFRLRTHSILAMNRPPEWADISKAPEGQLREPFDREWRMFCFSS